MTPTEERLTSERNIWLATTRPDGRPHLVPIWFVFTEGRFWVVTGTRSAKVRNLECSPRASVSLEDGDEPMVAETRATLHPTARPRAVVEAFWGKYEWDITADHDPDIGTPVLVELAIDRWLMGARA